MAFGFIKGWFGHPATKPTGVYAIKSGITKTIGKLPFIGNIYKFSKVLGSIIILVIGFIIYRKIK